MISAETTKIREIFSTRRPIDRLIIMDPEIWTGKGLEIRYTKA